MARTTNNKWYEGLGRRYKKHMSFWWRLSFQISAAEWHFEYGIFGYPQMCCLPACGLELYRNMRFVIPYNVWNGRKWAKPRAPSSSRFILYNTYKYADIYTNECKCNCGILLSWLRDSCMEKGCPPILEYFRSYILKSHLCTPHKRLLPSFS